MKAFYIFERFFLEKHLKINIFNEIKVSHKMIKTNFPSLLVKLVVLFKTDNLVLVCLYT